MTDDLNDVAPPNCPRCLVPMEVEGEDAKARWMCPECRLVTLSAS